MGIQPDPQHRATQGLTDRASFLLILTCCVATLTAVGTEFKRWSERKEVMPTPPLAEVSEPRKVTLTKLSATLIPMPQGVPSAHASALATLPGGELLVFWWAGSRESGPDVKVYASRWAKGNWSPAYEVASRSSLGSALGFGIRRIGNPVAWSARDGKIHLFVVATGLGGWAASRVVHMTSSDLGASFTVKRVLPMSPLFNTSVLVRNTPVESADGGWLLPAYFELGIKYPVVMAFDKEGNPRWLNRIGRDRKSLQPALVRASGNDVHAWMRDAGDQRRVRHAFSRDGGASWEDLPAPSLPNRDSSVAALRLTGGNFLLLHNHVAEGESGRNILRLSVSKDGGSWEHVFDVARGDASEEFSYPSLLQVGNELHVTYTSRRTAIAHHVYRINQEATLR